jgi:hypothetical protein
MPWRHGNLHPPKAARRRESGCLPDRASILSALPCRWSCWMRSNRFRSANPAAEQFFQLSSQTLLNMPLAELMPPDNRLFALVDQVRARMPGLRPRPDAGEPAPAPPGVCRPWRAAAGDAGRVVLTLQDGSKAQKLDRQLNFLGAARGASAMAQMLAHEVKNPLSGIRGAAQLLEQGASEGDRELCTLIQDEADRIRKLVERMEMFSDRPIEPRRGEHPLRAGSCPPHRQPWLRQPPADRRGIRSLAAAVWGNRDFLVQILLNLVKNAAEAVDPAGWRDPAHPPPITTASASRSPARANGCTCRCRSVSATTAPASPRTSAQHALGTLRHHQAGRAGARPRHGRQAGGGSGRADRMRQPPRAAPSSASPSHAAGRPAEPRHETRTE